MTTDLDDQGDCDGLDEGGLSRRGFIRLGLAGVAVAGVGTAGYFELRDRTVPIPATDTMVETAERVRARAGTGRTVTRTLTAGPAQVDLGGRVVTTTAYDQSLIGPLIRMTAGDRLDLRLTNNLPARTTIHWHGLALRNDMDGVPGVTMKSVAPSQSFDYSFVAPDPGTYWYHPHVGTQLDAGLYGPLIVDDPSDPGDYDVEAVLMLDDWTDGWGSSPDAILAGMRKNGMGGASDGMDGMEGMDGMMKGGPTKALPLGEDTGDVTYPAHLVNGRLPTDPYVLSAKPGQRIRIRIINAGADTAYRFAVGGHRLKVTHSDGFAVKAADVDTLIIGMGERYDVELTARDGAFAIAAAPEGKDDPAGLAILRTASGDAPTRSRDLVELAGQMLRFADLRPDESIRLPTRGVDRTLNLMLQMRKGGKQWLINGRTYADHEPLKIECGERVRIRMGNMTSMFHPMHLHGHTFAIAGSGVRKDTVNVLPRRMMSIDFEADNPGQWLMHCHNVYHGELGMMTVVSYEK